MKTRAVLAALMILCLTVVAEEASEWQDGVLVAPVSGFVPDSLTAIRVGDAVLRPVFGDEYVDRKLPLAAENNGDSLWIVRGTLPKNTLGGVPYIEIRKADCSVRRIYRYK